MRIFLLSTFFFFILLSSAYAQFDITDQQKVRIEKVYPNPMKTHVFIEITQDNYTTAKIELIDILGNPVQKWQDKSLMPGTQKVRLDFKNLRTGLYLLKVTINEHVLVKRLRKE